MTDDRQATQISTNKTIIIEPNLTQNKIALDLAPRANPTNGTTSTVKTELYQNICQKYLKQFKIMFDSKITNLYKVYIKQIYLFFFL